MPSVMKGAASRPGQRRMRSTKGVPSGLADLIFDGVNDAIVVVGLDDELVRFWNHAAETLYGWRAAEILGQPAEQLRTRYPGDVPGSKFLAAPSEQPHWRGEVTQQHRDGYPLYLEASIGYLRDASGASGPRGAS